MDQASLDRELRRAVARKAPGTALIVADADGVRARSAAGFADLRTRQRMTAEAVLPWFSMTKIATATLAMRLAERGTIDLDAPVLPLVPAMTSLRPQEWADRITPRHLLQHSGGLGNPIPVRWIHPADQPGPDPAVFLERLLAKHSKLRFEPGARSSYSNVGTLILGAALAEAAGVEFRALLHDEVLEPVGMSSTGFTFADDRPAASGFHPRRSPMLLLLPSWVRGEPIGPWTELRRFLLDGAPYGGLVGSPEDAARFLRMHLRGGEIDGTRVISEESALEMRRIDATGRRFDLGLGWFVPANARTADPPFVEHLGGGAGFLNVMRLYPTLGVGAVVMGNSTKYDVDAAAALAREYAA
jgi:CubicO group peptidase (beta-lactamase class C family)